MNASDRLAAWFYTGPLGHLYSTVADIVMLWIRWGLHRARNRRGPGTDHG